MADIFRMRELQAQCPEARFASCPSATFFPLNSTTKWSPLTVASIVFHSFGIIFTSCGALLTFTTLPVRKSPLL